LRLELVFQMSRLPIGSWRTILSMRSLARRGSQTNSRWISGTANSSLSQSLHSCLTV